MPEWVAAVAAMASLLLLAWSPAAGSVLSGLPQRIDPRSNYLIFLHGRIVEEHGPHPTDPRFGAYEYQGILDALAARGFAVVGEVRPQGTEIAAYAGHVVAQVQSLLAAGVPPRRIAVVGFSKGGAIALVAASRLHHPEVRFVSLAGCGDWSRPKRSWPRGAGTPWTRCAKGFGVAAVRLSTQARKSLEHGR